MPEDVKDVFGAARLDVQYGDTPDGAKPFGEGLPREIWKIVEDFDGRTYRAVYTASFAEVVYVLDAALAGISCESCRAWDSGRRPIPMKTLQSVRTTVRLRLDDGRPLPLKDLAHELGLNIHTVQAAVRTGRLAAQSTLSPCSVDRRGARPLPQVASSWNVLAGDQSQRAL
jgi:hypothetical protein